MKNISKKLLIVFFVVISAATQNHAQDIVYTVSGLFNNEKIALDSILVENLSNNTRILFGPLPARQEYLINLSQKLLTSVNGIADEGPLFSIAQNSPGVLKLKYNKNIPTTVKIAVYNINGQSLYSTSPKSIHPGNSVKIKLGASGVYLVKIESPEKVEAFKALGSGRLQNYDVNIEANAKNSVNILKSIDPPRQFEFNMGDSLRISVYKKDLYAWPVGTRIEGSEPVDFQFKQSSVNTTGISDAYIPLDEITTNITNYDVSTGDLEIEFTGEQKEVRPGSLITVYVDSMYVLLKVTECADDNNKIKLKTTPANLNEVFINKTFKLHTGIINPNTTLKSTSSPEDISKAFTDEDGYIHPFRISYRNKQGGLIVKSALNNENHQEEKTIPLIAEYVSLAYDFIDKGDVEEGNGIHFYTQDKSFFKHEPKDETISEKKKKLDSHEYTEDDSFLKLGLDAIYEFVFEESVGPIEPETKVEKGDIIEYKFKLVGTTELNVKLKLDATKTIKEGGYNREKKEGPAYTIDDIKIPEFRADFLVAGVYISVSFQTEIRYQYCANLDAEFYANWGFNYNNELTIGAVYDKQSGEFTYFSETDKNFKEYPLQIDGKIKAEAYFGIYPHIEALLYKFFGPFFEIVPYIDGEFNSNYEKDFGVPENEFLGWDNSFSAGLDFRVGSKWESWWGLFSHESKPKIVAGLEPISLWEMPKYVNLVSALPVNEITFGETIPLTFKVTNDSDFKDLKNKPVPLCPVYIEGDGDFDKRFKTTDENGSVTFNWTPNKSGYNKFNAKIFNANKEEIDIVTRSILAIGDFSGDKGIFKDDRDDNIYDWVKIGDQIWMAENLKHLPKGENLAPPSMPVTNISTIDYSDTYTKPYYYVYGSSGLFQNYVETQATMKAYGVLYNYTAAKSACPEEQGWRLPTDSDWEKLEEFIGNKYGYSKNTEYDYWEKVGNCLKSKTWGGDDVFGFNALPAGMRDRENGCYRGLGNSTYWWSSTPWLSDCSYERYLYNIDRFYRSHLFNQNGLSVRCIRD